MSFSVHSAALLEAIDQAVDAPWKSLFQRVVPPSLNHYTSEPKTVLSIIENRSIWAISLSEQRDEEELTHSIQMVKDILDRTSPLVPSFSRQVLERAAHIMEEGKRWFFIACFCNDDASERHYSEYGRYCLRVPTSGDQVLAGPASGVTCALQPIVYDTQLQRESLEEIVIQSISALAKSTRGENDGPTSKWNVDFCAKIIAHHLLSFALAFKRPEYKWEREWRMVCSPKMNPLHTAQSMLKAEFEVHIKAGIREHIDLRLKTKDRFVSGAMMSPVPVTLIKVPLSLSTDGDSLIRKTLKLYRCEDLFP